MSEEILDVNCGNKHGSIDHSDRECPHDVKKLEIRQSDAELRGPLTAPCDGGMDSNKCGPESASKPTGSDEVEQDVRCNGENTSDGEQCGSNKINLPVGSGTKQTAKDCNISEESQSIKRKANINKSSTVNSCDTDAESAEVKAIVTVNDDIDLSGNALNNAGLSTASTETKTKMKVKEPSIGELVLNDEKRVNGEDGSLEQGSSNKRVYHRHSRGSISSETGSVGSDTGERKSKRVSRPPPNTAPNPCGKRNCGSSEEIIVLDSAEEKAQEGKAEVNGSKSGEDVIKPKRRYRRRKTNVSANSTATEDSDTEDNLSLALLRYQEKTPAAPELDTNGRRNKASSAASSGFIQEVGKQPHGKGQSSCTSSSESHGSESGRGNHDNPMEGNSQDVLSKFQASQQVTVQSSPQKRMEQLLGQGEKNKPSTSKARKSLPSSSEKKQVRKMPRAKMSLSPNRLSSITIDSFFKPVDGRIRGRPKAKKSLSHGSKYKTATGQLMLQDLVMGEGTTDAQLSTTISSAAAAQALSALKMGSTQSQDNQIIPLSDICVSDAENCPASFQKSSCGKTSKMPKARKSFPHCRERQLLDDGHGKSAALESSQGRSESLPTSHMTFKIRDLENVFGLKKNLNKLDAKTLDKLVLECALKSKDRLVSKKQEQPSTKTDEDSCKRDGNSLSGSLSSFCSDHQAKQDTGHPARQEDGVNFASILTSQKILKKRKKRRRSRMGTYNLPACNKKYKAKKPKQSNQNQQVQSTSESDNGVAIPENKATSLCRADKINDETAHSKEDVSESAEEKPAVMFGVKKQRKRPYRKRPRYEPKKKIPKYIRARLRDLQKRIHMQCATAEQEEMYYQLESASRLNMHHMLPDALTRKRKRKSKGDDDTVSIISTSTSITESETSANSKESAIKKRRRTDDAIPSLSPVTDIPIVNHGYHINSLPPKISPQKVAGISMFKPLSDKAKLKLAKLSPGLECLDAVPGTKKHHIEGASGADVHRLNDQFQGLPPYKFHNTPNGITYPVTPPHTPEHGVSPADAVRAESEENREIQGSDHRSDFIPVCFCKLPSAVVSNTLPGHKTSLYCQALDSVNGKIVGCCSKVTNGQMVRPAHKIPFMVLCESHRERLKMHQCCPGCGQFCTEGKFLQCKSEVTKKGLVILHHFHAQCRTYKANKYFCPHCAHESDQYEVTLKYAGSRASWATVDVLSPSEKRLRYDGSKSARMGVLSPMGLNQEVDGSSGIEITVPHTSKTISSKKFPLGPTRSELENAMSVLDSDRAKKLRQGSKNLYKASKTGDVEKVIVMLADGADPNLRYEDDHNQSPLHAAAGMGHHLITHLLLQAGASPHVLDNSLSTPIILAAEKANMQILQILVKSGGLVDARRADGMTSLHLAAQSGKVDAVRFLLETEKISVNVKDDGGWTPLIWAAEHSHLDVVHYLLASGADPNIRDNEGNTALHWAAFSGSTDIAEIFLNAGCDLETVNEIGDRPLHIAARQDHYECVVLFLARGADSEARNNDNEAPIGCCIEQHTPTWMALRVNRQLQGFATRKLQHHERLLHRDISYGRDSTPMPVVNMVDDENYPTDFLYVVDCVETTPMNVNRLITSLAACRCKENCGSLFCECSHNSVKCWYEKDGKLVKDFNYSDPPLIFECNKACRCWSSCQNRVVQLGITCRLQVFRTNGRGWGARTMLDIPQGTFVCEYIGELISDAEADSREDDSYLFDLDNKDTDTYCIDARHYGNISRFINHLCQPNLIPIKVFIDHQDLRFPRICFFASRDIKAYEELGFDYGEKFWIIKWKQFTCTCGSVKCRYSKDTIHKTLEDYNRRQGDDERVVEQP